MTIFPPRQDISNNAEDVRRLVDTFYGKIKADPLLAPVFTEVAKVDWGHHLPVMYQFWEMLLFRKEGYEGNPFLKHVVLPVEREHFQRWLALFTETVDELFEGPKASEAKIRASNIAGVFQARMGLVRDPLA